MRILAAFAFAFLILSLASCVISGGHHRTRVQKYVDMDTLSKKVTSDSVELYFKGQPNPKFAYDKVARITLTGGRDDNSGKLIGLLVQKAKEIYCDAVVYVEFDNVERHYATLNPFWEGIDEDIIVLEITGLAVKKRVVETDSIP